MRIAEDQASVPGHRGGWDIDYLSPGTKMQAGTHSTSDAGGQGAQAGSLPCCMRAAGGAAAGGSRVSPLPQQQAQAGGVSGNSGAGEFVSLLLLGRTTGQMLLRLYRVTCADSLCSAPGFAPLCSWAEEGAAAQMHSFPDTISSSSIFFPSGSVFCPKNSSSFFLPFFA